MAARGSVQAVSQPDQPRRRRRQLQLAEASHELQTGNDADAAAMAAAVSVALSVDGENRAAAVAPTAEQVQAWSTETDYSEKYCDEVYEYRRVTVPRAMLPTLPHGRCMSEAEWRAHGLTMSRGWEHYDHHSPEANVLLFRRVRGTDPKTGEAPPEMKKKAEAREAYVVELEQLRQKALAEQARKLEEKIPDQY